MKKILYSLVCLCVLSCTDGAKIRDNKNFGLNGDVRYVSVSSDVESSEEFYVVSPDIVDVVRRYVGHDADFHLRVYYDVHGVDSLITICNIYSNEYIETSVGNGNRDSLCRCDKYDRIVEIDGGDFVAKIEYNELGDVSRVVNGGSATYGGFYICKGDDILYEYKYDSIGNWIERRGYNSNNKSLRETVTREIQYGDVCDERIEDILVNVLNEEKRIKLEREARSSKAGRTKILHGFEFGMTEAQLEQHKNKLKKTGGLVKDWIWGWVVSIPTTSSSNAKAILMMPEYYQGGMRSVRFHIDEWYHSSSIWDALVTANPDAECALTKEGERSVYTMVIDNVIIRLEVGDSDADLSFIDAPYIELMETEQKKSDKEKASAYKM